MEVNLILATNLSKRELLRRKRLEQKRRKTITFILIAVGAVVLISLIIFIPNFLRGQAKSAEGRGFTIGDPNAPVTVVNFSNFACVHCENFSKNTEPDFIANYIETGDVFYRYVTVASPTDLATQNAAIASYCADEQGLFFDYKPYLYPASVLQDGFSTSNLINMAETAGLDRASFEACLESSAHQQAPIDDFRFAQSVGVTGTPSFLVNDQLVFSNELIALVESLLNK